jgi:hypothetical protein
MAGGDGLAGPKIPLTSDLDVPCSMKQQTPVAAKRTAAKWHDEALKAVGLSLWVGSVVGNGGLASPCVACTACSQKKQCKNVKKDHGAEVRLSWSGLCDGERESWPRGRW